MIKNSLASENSRLQKVLSERNRKIRELEETVSFLRTQLSDAEKLIAALQESSLDVLEDLDGLQEDGGTGKCQI
jgi:chromosome segregation ATPase